MKKSIEVILCVLMFILAASYSRGTSEDATRIGYAMIAVVVVGTFLLSLGKDK